MNNSLRKRIFSAFLALLLILSNLNITAVLDMESVAAADFSDEQTQQELFSNETEESSETESQDVSPETEKEQSEASDPQPETEEAPDTGELSESETEEELSEETEAFSAEADESSAAVFTDDPEDTQAAVVTGNFRISGAIDFNENAGGTNWKSLVRPSEFNQPIKITLTYQDSEGQEQNVVYDTQDDVSKNSFYLKFIHDGDGAGSFTIENVPKSLTDSHGQECQVTAYSVNVDPSLPYYEDCNNFHGDIKDPATTTAVTGTLQIKLKTQTLTLSPTVVPSDGTDNPAFTMKTTFTNPQLTSTSDAGRKLEATYRPTKSTPAQIQVPAGLSYSVVQSAADGYRFDNTYTTTTKNTDSGEESEGTKSTGSAAGTIESDTNVTITTENTAQNLSVGFDVKWIDNEKTTRPVLSEDNFVLQYKTGDGEWINLDSSQYETLGIESGKEPKFDASQKTLNQYSYTGLPAVDAEGNALTYQVIEKNVPDGYKVSTGDGETSGRRIFTFEETTDFTAEIQWNDTDNTQFRPESIESLKLYRRVGNGSYELVYDEIPEGAVTKEEGSVWSVKLAGLTRYNSDNQEYDYVLVQGRITHDTETDKDVITQESIENFQTHYDNGSGSFGNDTALCHNNGTITEVLYEAVDFKADKVWKDPTGTADSRPTTTVTLWRYTESQANGIDEAYQKGVAAQVVFQTKDADGNVKENIVS